MIWSWRGLATRLVRLNSLNCRESILTSHRAQKILHLVWHDRICLQRLDLVSGGIPPIRPLMRMVAENGSEVGPLSRGLLLWVSILEDHPLLFGVGLESVCVAWPWPILLRRFVVHFQLPEVNIPGWLFWHQKHMLVLSPFAVAGLS